MIILGMLRAGYWVEVSNMDYEEAVDAIISRTEAKHEIEKHGLSWIEFLAEVGDKQEYEGSEILDWLGY